MLYIDLCLTLFPITEVTMLNCYRINTIKQWIETWKLYLQNTIMVKQEIKLANISLDQYLPAEQVNVIALHHQIHDTLNFCKKSGVALPVAKVDFRCDVNLKSKVLKELIAEFYTFFERKTPLTLIFCFKNKTVTSS